MMRPTLSTLSIPIIGGENSGQQKNITSKEGKEIVKNLSHADPTEPLEMLCLCAAKACRSFQTASDQSIEKSINSNDCFYF